MFTFTAQELKEKVKFWGAKDVPEPPTVFVLGDPGIGKSYSIREAAEEMGKEYILLSLSRLEAYDIKGIPDVHGDYVDWKAPSFWKKVIDSKGEIVVHLDEFTLSTEDVQGAVLDIIHEKKIDQLMLPKRTQFILSGNMGGDDGTSAKTVTSAITGGRCFIYKMITPSVTEWIAYQKPVEVIEQFLSSKGPETLYKGPKVDEPFEPWTNPRSWSKLDNMIKAKKLNYKDDHDLMLIIELANGVLSPSTMTAFQNFLKDAVIEPTKLFALQTAAWGKYNKAEPFKKSFALKEVASLMDDIEWKKDRNKRREALQKFFDKLIADGSSTPEILNQFAANIGSKDPVTYEKLTVKGKRIGDYFDTLLKAEASSKKKE